MTQSNHPSIFCSHGPKSYTTADQGPLKGVTLAVKDLFHLAGEKNGAGNPDWFASAEAATETAESLERLLQAGAEFVGFTHTDELAYSLSGNNAHYGIAENPKLPGHHSGGSSMGSAAAIAAELCDLALGTDTGGSIRVPASYCGIYGFRPSHGEVSVEGLIALAESFDTVGWFTRNAQLLETAGELLLPSQPVNSPSCLLVCDELWQLAAPELQNQLPDHLQQLSPYFDRVERVHLGQDTIFSELPEIFRVLQGADIKRQHQQWVESAQPTFGSDVQARFDMAFAITDEEEAQAKAKQTVWQQEFSQLMQDQHAVLLLPSTPDTAPAIGSDQSSLRVRLLNLTAIAGLTGSCQVHVPSTTVTQHQLHKPAGFSLLMQKKSDRSLLRLVKEITENN